jgi:hypothetical protein
LAEVLTGILIFFSDNDVLRNIAELVRKISSSSSSDDSPVPPRDSIERDEFVPFLNKKISIAMNLIGGSTARYHADKFSNMMTIAFGRNYLKNGNKPLAAFMGNIYIMRRAFHRWALFNMEKKHLFVAAGAAQVKTVVKTYTKRHVGDKA